MCGRGERPGAALTSLARRPSGRGVSLEAEDDRDLAAHALVLYAEQGLSARGIAEQLGVGRPRVTAWLKAAGIELGARGRGRPRANRRLSDPGDLGEVLKTLYVDQRLDAKTIGTLLGMSERTVRSRLEEHGIPRRSKGGFDRRDRLDPDSKVIEELYVRLGMTANQVAARMGTSRKTVLRAAHEHGLPVPQPPSVPAEVPGRARLVYDLYRDPLVTQVLARHRVPVVPPVGPIWVRFPDPVPLGEELARALYEGDAG